MKQIHFPAVFASLISAVLFFSAPSVVKADDRESLADKHAPAFLMGDHMHNKGGWMMEYKYMNMYMDGNRVGTQEVTDQQALTIGQSLGTNFGATPTQMNMEMHMMHIMYGLSDDVTVYTMPMFTALTMDHIRGPANPAPQGPGSPFTTTNLGFDDLTFGALLNLYDRGNMNVIFNAGFSVPTGDLDKTSSNPTGGIMQQELPYPMRRGSGTFNARPAITFKNYFDWYSTGLQYAADIPVGKNKEGYRVSNIHRVNTWISALLTDRFALSYRVEGLWKSNFSGADPDLNPAVISTARTDMRASESINFGYGAMMMIGKGNLLNVEITHPVYQSFNGIQLDNDFWLTASWSKGFGGGHK